MHKCLEDSEKLGGGKLRLARDLAPKPREQRGPEPPFSTAQPALDRLLEGGLARGALVEMTGRRTSGRFAHVLGVLAAATGVGETCALVDLGDHLDPRSAAAAGVDLDRLLWLRPRTMKETLAAAEMVLATGFPLVVVDLGMPPVRGGRGAEAAWLRLARAARDRGAALLVSSPYRVSGTAAALVLEARSEARRWHGRGLAPRLLGEMASRLTVQKKRGGAPGAEGVVRLLPGFLPSGRPAPLTHDSLFHPDELPESGIGSETWVPSFDPAFDRPAAGSRPVAAAAGG